MVVSGPCGLPGPLSSLIHKVQLERAGDREDLREFWIRFFAKLYESGYQRIACIYLTTVLQNFLIEFNDYSRYRANQSHQQQASSCDRIPFEHLFPINLLDILWTACRWLY